MMLWYVCGMKPAFQTAAIWLTAMLYGLDLWGRVARLAGLEPATGCLEGSCSIRLSYRRLSAYCARRRSRTAKRTRPA
jgi:hypothetical protein